MAYWLESLVFPDADLEVLFKPLTHINRVSLPQRLCLVSVTREFRDEIAVHYSINPSSIYRELDLLSGPIIEFAKAISRTVPIAYVQATYTGGTGGQSAIVWKDGEVKLGPLTESAPEGTPINRALQFLGVSKGEAVDEFEAIGLHLHRWTGDWPER